MGQYGDCAADIGKIVSESDTEIKGIGIIRIGGKR